MIVERDGTVCNMFLEQLLTPLKFFEGQLPKPLKRRKGLRNKTGNRNRHLAAAAPVELGIKIHNLLG